MSKIRLGSLFTGIAGLELGICEAMREASVAHEVSWQIEKDEFCGKVLDKNYPGVYRGITDVKKANQGIHRFVDITGPGSVEVFRRNLHLLAQVDWMLGGFPCQDLSLAGKGEGLDGDRSGLFWEYLRIVRDLRPRIVIMENVPGLLTRGLSTVLGALAEIGYHAQWRVLSAADVGAPHLRERVFIVAYRNSAGRGGLGRSELLNRKRTAFRYDADRCGSAWNLGNADKAGWIRGSWFGGVDAGDGEPANDDLDMGKADSARLEERQGERGDNGAGLPSAFGANRNNERVVHTDSGEVRVESERRSGGRPRRLQGQGEAEPGHDRRSGRQGYAFGFLGGGTHGVSAGMDGHRLPERWPAGPGRPQESWEPSRTTKGEANRAKSLKAYGNAVCPKVAKEIGRWALEIDADLTGK